MFEKKNRISPLKVILVLAIVIALAIIVAFAIIKINAFFKVEPLEIENKTVISIADLQQEILSIGELATIEYNYKNVIIESDSRRIGDWDIPFTQKSYIITVEGTMKIGIDVSEIIVAANEETETVSITIPKAKILSHELHEDSLEVLEEKSGLFNRVKIADWAELATTQKKEMEDKVSGTDAFTRAQDDTARILETLVGGAVPEDYTVTFTKR